MPAKFDSAPTYSLTSNKTRPTTCPDAVCTSTEYLPTWSFGSSILDATRTTFLSLAGAAFPLADFRGAALVGASLAQADLRDADLSGARFSCEGAPRVAPPEH